MTSLAFRKPAFWETTGMSLDVVPTSRREDAYERVLAAIIFGDLAPGSAVDEKSLARGFELGVAGVREALGRLELEGLVERQPRIGTKIATLGVRELQDVFETRLILEPSCAAIAANRADSEDLAKFRRFAEEYMEIARTRDLRKLVRLDQYFHRAVAAATKNALMERQVTVLHNNASRFWFANAPRLSDEALQQTLSEHMKVSAAIEQQDSAAAEKAMRKLLGDFPGFVDFYRSNWPTPAK
ncbi:Carbon starvation induced regulator (plasmid) [Variovorax sp. SRS16]|uniref:GntR family transcriptional regulator n=1 Tax=Variovorax sp. SRS16 TaxID=282217 RepID=UPI0013171AF0|nr:GntR family transcriptional regulator [Variovorax sp. SRS16]VTU46475.1 Carbon starvation induced regulator [Variovorax sp. SRS16]